MSHRRTMGATILNESVQSGDVASPLRRRSLALPRPATARKELIQNDDESERLARRRQEASLNSPKTGEASGRRVSLGLGAGMSSAELTEHFNKCLRLCAENKINSKNVFSLSVIDYMAVFNKRDQNPNNMQTAGTSLDVSTKVYSLRVDCVHGVATKMAVDPGKRDKQNEDGAAGDGDGDSDGNGEDAANTTNAKEPEVKKKRKRRVQQILCPEESNEIEVEEAFLVPKKTDDDSQTNDMLLTIRLPIHRTNEGGLHNYEDVLFDNLIEEEGDESGENNLETDFFDPEDYDDLNICPTLMFDFLGWSVDDVAEAPPTQEQNGVQDEPGEIRFDINASLIDNYENDNTGMNYFDLDEGSQENIDRCGRMGREEPEKIVDFMESVADKEPTDVPEYSYLQRNSTNLHWAGPTHWKPKLITKAPASSRVIGACRQEGVRRKKEVTLEQGRDATEVFFDKLQAKIPRKLQSKTLRQTWQEEKLTLPEDVHYDNANPTKFYFQSSMRKLLYLERKPDEVTEPNGEGNALLEEVAANYNYDNLNDTLDYCSQNNGAEHIEGDDTSPDLFDDHGKGEKENEDPNGDNFLPNGFTGENLIAAPRATTQTQINYATKAKKIDMRLLKKSIWKALTFENNVNKENEGGGNKAAKDTSAVLQINESRNFSTIYKELPDLLGKENTEALSPALAFASLLHLANEKCLSIMSTVDMSDLQISQN